MSLRARLLALMTLTLLALGAGGALVLHAVGTTQSAREAAAERQATGLSRALADTSVSASAPPGALEHALSTVLAGTVEVDAGFCDRAGQLLARAGTNPEGRRHPPDHPLPPDLRDTVAMACASGVGGLSKRRHPRDVSVVSVWPAGADRLAFAVVRAPQTPAGDDAPAPLVILLVLATVGLAIVALEAWFVLRRGSQDLESVLAALPEQSVVAHRRPRALELSRIVDQVQSMTERLGAARQRERELERTLAHGQRLASLGRMAAGVAHEIRNPLGGLKLRLDLLARTDGVTPQMLADVEVCQGEVARLNRVVETLLDVSRKDLVTVRAVDLRPLVEARVSAWAPRKDGPQRGVRVEGAVRARADADATGRIIDNLVRNALAAAPGGEVSVHLSKDAEWAVLDVEDDGAGIPPTRVAELFEPFFTLRDGGTGLGLWLSRSLAEAQGGSLSYERLETRTRFRLVLPWGGP